MSETFKYPNATSPTKTLTFATSAHSINDGDIIEFNQISDVTIGGIRMVKSLGDNFNRWEYTIIIPLSSGSETDYTDVLSFVGSSYANGSLGSFVWTDYAATAKTVHMINNPFTAKRLGSSAYMQCTFLLEEVNT